MYYRIAAALLVGASFAGTVQAGDFLKNWDIDAGVFYPQSQLLKDAFGDNWITFGISPSRKPDKYGWLISPDANIIYNDSDGSRVLMIPVSVGLANRTKIKGSDWTPYVAARVGAAYVDYGIRTSPSTKLSDTDWVMNANAEAGIIYKDSVRIRARYDWFGKSNDVLFDGLSLTISWTAIRF